jgi:hypothetical protein
MLYSRSAAFFKRLADHSMTGRILSGIVETDKYHMEGLVTHKEELDRVYSLIEQSARGGAVRIFLEKDDPLLNNLFVVSELQKQGFQINPHYHSQTAIEWYAADWNKKGELM